MYSGTESGPGVAVSAGKAFQSSIDGSPSRAVEHIAVDFDLKLLTHLFPQQVKILVTNLGVGLTQFLSIAIIYLPNLIVIYYC